MSALIHAATMVTAGVYLMCRVSPLLHTVPNVGTIIAVVGAATALFAATVAVAQNDIKKVLAYSTVSQLGYMFLAVGSGAYVAAIFHMVTHAFFKALMFLGSGSVIHGMRDEQDMRRMGRLRKLMPITAVTFIVGWLAIAGVPPFSGFWSKDEILLAASQKSWALWAVGFVTALLTAYYMTRQVIMVFFGEAHWQDAKDKHAEAVAAGHSDAAGTPGHSDAAGHGDHAHAGEPHESSWIMLTPLVALAGLAIVGGGLNLPFTSGTKKLEHWLDPVVGEAERQVHVSTGLKVGLAVITALACIAAIGLAYAVYQRRRMKAVEPAILAEAWRYDWAVSWFMGNPGRQGFEAVTWADATIVDGAVNGTATGIRSIGTQLRRLQTGYVRNYALGIAIGAVLMLAWFVSRGVF